MNKYEKREIQSRTNPTVTIILPTYNEEEHIEKCLESLITQDYPNIVEIFVIDAISADRTKDVILYTKEKTNKNIILVEDRSRQYVGVNVGIRKSRGEIIINADAHAFYAPDYVTQCVEYLIKTGAGSVGGPVRIRSHDSYLAKAIGFIHESRFGIGVAKFRRPSYEGYVDTVWPGAFWHSVFDKIGLYKEDTIIAGSDLEFNTRLRKHGYKIFSTPKIKAYYIPRKRLFLFLKQCFRNGRDIISITKALGISNMRLRHFIPILFVSILLLLCFASLFNPIVKSLFLALLLAYGLVTILASVNIAVRQGFYYIFIVPFLFITVHFTYGIGSLWELAKLLFTRTLRKVTIAEK